MEFKLNTFAIFPFHDREDFFNPLTFISSLEQIYSYNFILWKTENVLVLSRNILFFYENVNNETNSPKIFKLS